MAMACLRLFTLPPLPDFRVPFLRRRIALSTLLAADLLYFRPRGLFFLGGIFDSSLNLERTSLQQVVPTCPALCLQPLSARCVRYPADRHPPSDTCSSDLSTSQAPLSFFLLFLSVRSLEDTLGRVSGRGGWAGKRVSRMPFFIEYYAGIADRSGCHPATEP